MSKKSSVLASFLAPVLVLVLASISKPAFAELISGADLKAKFEEYIPASGEFMDDNYELIGEGKLPNGRGCTLRRKIDHLSICLVIFSAADNYLVGNCFSHHPDPTFRVEYLEEPGTSLTVYELYAQFSSVQINTSGRRTDVTIQSGYFANEVKSATCSLN